MTERAASGTPETDELDQKLIQEFERQRSNKLVKALEQVDEALNHGRRLEAERDALKAEIAELRGRLEAENG